MRLPQTSISRPISATVLSLIIMLLGGAAMLQLPISEYPEVVPPTIAINASYPGANPETVAQTVASPLEQQLTGLDGLLYMSSQHARRRYAADADFRPRHGPRHFVDRGSEPHSTRYPPATRRRATTGSDSGKKPRATC